MSDRNQTGSCCLVVFSRSTFWPWLLEGIDRVARDLVPLDGFTRELAVDLLDRFREGRTEREAAFISIS